MGFILSYLTHRLEADAPRSMMLPARFSSPDLCTESSPKGEGRGKGDNVIAFRFIINFVKPTKPKP